MKGCSLAFPALEHEVVEVLRAFRGFFHAFVVVQHLHNGCSLHVLWWCERCHHTTPRHTTPHHTTPHHTTPHHTTQNYTTPHHTTPHHTKLHHTTPHHTPPHHTTPHHTTPHLVGFISIRRGFPQGDAKTPHVRLGVEPVEVQTLWGVPLEWPFARLVCLWCGVVWCARGAVW